MSGFASLRRFLEQKSAAEWCDLCAAPLAPRHQHLVDPQAKRLICACDPCAILFPGTGETRYRRVPRDAFALSDFDIRDEQWNALAIPIGLVFFFHSSVSGSVLALYPSPAGPTETVVDPECWEELCESNPRLRRMASDVEALLINRIDGARDYYLAPIDQCYKLTGLVRAHWRGFSGGDEAWTAIAEFFGELKPRARPARVEAHA